MILSASGFFDARRRISEMGELIARVDTVVPAEYVKLYKQNVIPYTPKRTSALRRSVITRSSKGVAEIGYRVPYAVVQNRGYHSQTHTVRGWNQRDGGFGTIKPGRYVYSRYTTPGTGSQFFAKGKQKTDKEFPAKLRILGYGRR